MLIRGTDVISQDFPRIRTGENLQNQTGETSIIDPSAFQAQVNGHSVVLGRLIKV